MVCNWIHFPPRFCADLGSKMDDLGLTAELMVVICLLVVLYRRHLTLTRDRHWVDVCEAKIKQQQQQQQQTPHLLKDAIFIIAIFTMTKIWKGSKYLLMGEWIKKLWYIDG